MSFLLPDSRGFSEFEEFLSGDSVGAIPEGIDHEFDGLTIPRFEMESAFRSAESISLLAGRLAVSRVGELAPKQT